MRNERSWSTGRLRTRRPLRPENHTFRVALALGGNLGDPEAAFRAAIKGLQSHLVILNIAPVYRSSPISPIPQPAYLNTALLADTRLDPWQLLGLAKALELAAGRTQAARFGARPLDIDLLFFDDLQVDEPELQIPHPRLRQRRFFLAPLAELAADQSIPPDGETVAELLAALGDEQQIEKIGWRQVPPH
ncbi:MAG: 2-amino-4-hydroxy-6-hydroxymethyldihydropteridine diphosphokinase [Thermoanaerobaculia bacterium]